MEESFTKEIDLFDLFIDWISHWKSLLVVMLLGMILFGGYMYIGHSTTVGTELDIEENLDFLDNMAEGTLLSSLTPKQLQTLSLKDMEKYFLSEKDITAVDDVITLEEEYNANLDEYNLSKSDLELVDRAESFNYIANTKNIIEVRKASLTADQQIYYYTKLGISIVVNVDGTVDTVEKKSIDDGAATSIVSKKKIVFIIIMMITLHFIFFACRYIFDNTIKHSDNIASMVNIPEYIRMIDWEKIDSQKGIDKLINKIRFYKTRKTALKDVVEINAATMIEKLKSKNYDSIAIVGGLEKERNMIVNQLENDRKNFVVKSIDSITHSVNGSFDIVGTDAAILVARVGVSRYYDLIEELRSLRDRNVEVIGAVVLE